jgi:hypothetical protein
LKLLQRIQPKLAQATTLQFGSEIASARHALKLLDDNQKYYEGVYFARINAEHMQRFRLGCDLEVVALEGRLVSTTRIADFQRALKLKLSESGSRSQGRGYTYNFASEIGSVLGAVLNAFRTGAPEVVPLCLPASGTPSVETTVRAEYYGSFQQANNDVVGVLGGEAHASRGSPLADCTAGPH